LIQKSALAVVLAQQVVQLKQLRKLMAKWLSMQQLVLIAVAVQHLAQLKQFPLPNFKENFSINKRLRFRSLLFFSNLVID
jgi:hypothetical protein